MTCTRFSLQQKTALREIHLIELKSKIGELVSTMELFNLTQASLPDVQLSYNHFFVGIKTLSTRGFVECIRNTNKIANKDAKQNIVYWRLTTEGRQFGETYHSSKLRPIRTYTKRTSRLRTKRKNKP